MKKIIIGLVLAAFMAISLTSCRSTKPPCPAYSSVNNISTTVQHIAGNFVKKINLM